MQYWCYKDYSYTGVSCGVVHAEAPFTVTKGDMTKAYPDCCPQIVESDEQSWSNTGVIFNNNQ